MTYLPGWSPTAKAASKSHTYSRGESMKRDLLTILALFLLYLVSNAPAKAQQDMSVREEIPEEVREVAAQALQNWKEGVTKKPDAFGLKGKEDLVEAATIGQVFRKYQLHRENTVEYLDAATMDPVPFAASMEYIFPLHSGEVYLGGLRVRYREKQTPPATVQIGNYSWSGIDTRLDETNNKAWGVAEQAAQRGDLSFIGQVRFTSGGIDDYFVVELDNIKYFVASESVAVPPIPKIEASTLRMNAPTLQGMADVKRKIRKELATRIKPGAKH
jgi:hypothetical protein